MKEMSSISDKYQKLTQLQHLLKRPHMYIGEIYDTEQEMYVFDHDSKKMKLEHLTYNPGIVKLFDEIILNACDHAIETGEVTKIKVNIDPKEGCISIYNNGPGIPVSMHTEEHVYIPELIFTHFLTSSNYDDSQTRLKSGLNGLGAKITSAYSSTFMIETVWDSLSYKQVYKNNLQTIQEPKIKKVKTADFTRITFYPDFEKFKVEGITKETMSVLERRVYDIAAYTDDKVKVYYNNELINVNSFKDYISLFMNDKQVQECTIQCSKRWKVAICSSENETFSSHSFVNGVHTIHDGTHVNYVLNQAIRYVSKKYESKMTIRPAIMKEHLFVILFANIENPEFKSQAKEQLTSNVKDFGSTFEFDSKSLRKIAQMEFVSRVQNYIQYKMSQKLSKDDGKKRIKLTGIPNLDDANKAGSKDSSKCTLFLTEGLSAKTFAVAGLSVIGRDYYGIFPLKGKLLNVRSANIKQIIGNSEVGHIKQILGLSSNKKYNSPEDLKELRYGKVCILADSDDDGVHIRGLLINLFHYFWPELVKNNFLTYLKTPIVKASKGTIVHAFYQFHDYKQWKKNESTQGYKIKYYKGLGSSTSKEAKESFQRFDQDTVKFICNTPEDEDVIDLAFGKHRIQDRKQWIRENTGKELKVSASKKVSTADFFNKEFVQFSISDCERSIPNLMDGLKPSQRKILYGFLKKNTLNELKVDQIRGYIAEQTLYAHGETSLNETIISMNQDYVGSNNINLFIPCGAFGSRLMGGKDSASPRYISTKLNPITKVLFNEHDSDQSIIKYRSEGDTRIEPEYYVPVIPMILVNGTTGIGTGFSTDVPCYNPVDIIQCIKTLLDDPTIHTFDLLPWYKGFTGKIYRTESDHGLISQGLIERSGNNKLRIRELPIGVWTERYKEFLEKLIERNTIKSFLNYSTETTIDFIVQCHSIDINNWVSKEMLLDVFKLRQPLKVNLTLFDETLRLVHFKNVSQIIVHFFKVRLNVYEKRRKHLIQTKSELVEQLDDKVRFIQSVINGTIVVFRNSKQQVLDQIKKGKFNKIDGSYDHLLDIKIHQFTNEKVKEYTDRLNVEAETLSLLKRTTVKQMWSDDLDQLIL